MMKRCLDLVLACLGLLLVLPLFPFIGLLIKLDSTGTESCIAVLGSAKMASSLKCISFAPCSRPPCLLGPVSVQKTIRG